MRLEKITAAEVAQERKYLIGIEYDQKASAAATQAKKQAKQVAQSQQSN